MRMFILNSYVLCAYLPGDVIKLINTYIINNSVNTIIFYYRTKCEIKFQIINLILYEKSLFRRDGIININRIPLILKIFKAAERWISGIEDYYFWTRHCFIFKKELHKLSHYYSSYFILKKELYKLEHYYSLYIDPCHDYINKIGLKFNIIFY